METQNRLLEGRLRDLVATADGQLASQSFDAAVDTYRTALAELSGDADAAVRADIEGRLAAAQKACETSWRVTALLGQARYDQTAGRFTEAFAAAAEALSLDPSNHAAAQLRKQLAEAMPELAGVAEPARSPVEVSTDLSPEDMAPAQLPRAEPPSAPPPEPEPEPAPEPHLLETSHRELPEPEPELLSILDPEPPPQRRDPVRTSSIVLILLAMGAAMCVVAYLNQRPVTVPAPPAEVPAKSSPPPAPVPPMVGTPTVPDDTVYYAGSGVTLPMLRSKVEPEYTEEARRAKYQGTVVLSIQVDGTGKPVNIRVIRGLDMGLTGSAIEAVSKWRFRPGMQDGQPVTVWAQVEVKFRLL